MRERVRVCLRCHDHFRTTDSRQHYCSPRCKNAAAQQRFRDREKAKRARIEGGRRKSQARKREKRLIRQKKFQSRSIFNKSKESFIV